VVGLIAGVDNGSEISHESFKANRRHAFHGMALAIVQSAAGRRYGVEGDFEWFNRRDRDDQRALSCPVTT
jgi:hypothetical protein